MAPEKNAWVDLVDKTHPITYEHGLELHEQFEETSIIHFRQLFGASALQAIRERVCPLLKMTARKDTERGGTPRKMNTLDAKTISQYAPDVKKFYKDTRLRKFLEGIFGEMVFLLDDAIGQFVLNVLKKKGDTHGGHLDRHPLAFNVIVQTPKKGGLVEFVPDSGDAGALNSDRVKTIRLEAGDAYLLKADTSVHRVAPISEGQRIALSFSYSDVHKRKLKAYAHELYQE